ncbi:MAG: hypothetical protein ABFS19_12065 [Thermodesulfobacteriota bacterium]
MNGKFIGNVVLCIGLLALFVFGVSSISATPDVAGLLRSEIKVDESAKSLNLTASRISRQEKGHMVDAAFTVENNSDHEIGRLTVVCDHQDKNGKSLGRDQWIIFENIQPKSSSPFKLTEKKYIDSALASSDCRIVDASPAAKPLVTVHRVVSGHAAGHDEASGNGDGHH